MEPCELLCEVGNESFYLSQLEAVGEDFHIPTINSEENKFNPVLETTYPEFDTEPQPPISNPSNCDACKERH